MSELKTLNEIIERKHKEIYKLNRQIFFAQRKIHKANLHDAINAKEINLNVGAGDTYIDKFIGLDYHTKHFGNPISKGQMPFNIRSDKIPFDANSVTNIYISHVIEHVEDIHVERFFSEAHRVLKPRGVLRVTCPDAEYIWDRGRFDLSFWKRRISWFKKRGINTNDLDAFDYIIREISTPKLRCVDASSI
jgi:SAM-dependent methyltransferase